VCPVDCIQMVPVDATATGWAAWSPAQAEQARQRYRARQARLQRTEAAHQARLLAKAEAKLADLPAHSKHTDPAVLERKRALIEAALARARAARAAQAQERGQSAAPINQPLDRVPAAAPRARRPARAAPGGQTRRGRARPAGWRW